MDNFRISQLLKTYGSLLTQNQFETAKSYFDFDITLSEIAALQGVSRQSVNDTLIKVKAVLENYENKLSFVKKTQNIKKELQNSPFHQKIENILES